MRDPTSEQLPRSLRGRFWFPENPNLMLTGELLISKPHNYDLELDLPHYGPKAPGYWASMLGKPISTVLGILNEGGKVTCRGCRIYSSKPSYDAPHSVSRHRLGLSADRCFLGAHIPNEETIRVRQFSSFFTGFNQWALLYDNELFSEQDETELTKIKRSDAIDGFGRLKIWRAFSENGSVGDVGKQVKMRYWRPSFEPVEPISIDEMLETIRTFQFLLALLQGRAVGFNDLRAEMIQAGESDAESNVRHVETMTKMIGSKQRFSGKRDSDPLLSLKEIGDYWPTLVSAWFKCSKSIALPFNLYFAVLFTADVLFDEQKFQFLAQALEGYHRCKFKVAKDIKFLERLRELANPNGDILSVFIGDLPSFLEAVVNVRDEFAHGGLGKKNLADVDAYTLWRQVKAMFEICALRDLGVPAQALRRIAEECNEWIGPSAVVS